METQLKKYVSYFTYIKIVMGIYKILPPSV